MSIVSDKLKQKVFDDFEPLFCQTYHDMYGITPILSVFHIRFSDKTGVVITEKNHNISIIYLDDVLSGTKKLDVSELNYLARHVFNLFKKNGLLW